MAQQGSATRFRDFGRWTLSRMGMASNDRLRIFCTDSRPPNIFIEMKIPLSIVATDLLTANRFISPRAKSVPLCALPAPIPDLFLPVEYRNHFLVDGFLTEKVPAPAVREHGRGNRDFRAPRTRAARFDSRATPSK